MTTAEREKSMSEDPAFSRLIQTYMALLLLPHNVLRVRLQPELAACRDAIALGDDREPQDVQDEYELKATRLVAMLPALLAAGSPSPASGGEWNDAVEAAAKRIESPRAGIGHDLLGVIANDIRALKGASPSPSEIGMAICNVDGCPGDVCDSCMTRARAVLALIRGERRT